MSYLVDALRKAERERLQGAAPGKATLAVDAPYDDERGGLGRVGWVVAVLVGCNLMLFGYLLWPAASAPSGVTAPEIAAAPPAATGFEAARRSARSAHQPATAPAVSPQGNMEGNMAPQRTASTAGMPGADVTSEREELEAGVGRVGRSSGQAYPAAASQGRPIPARNEVPPVNIHGHMFSADPAESFILVDGRIYHEGERLPDGVAVVRIDQEGALLNYRGRRFHVNGPG